MREKLELIGLLLQLLGTGVVVLFCLWVFRRFANQASSYTLHRGYRPPDPRDGQAKARRVLGGR